MRTENAAAKTSSEATKVAMDAQVQGLHDRQQEIATRVTQVTSWLATTKIVGVAAQVAQTQAQVAQVKLNLQQAQLGFQEVESGLETKVRELSAAVASACAGGFGTFQGAAASATRDRNVFDPRDYKLAELGPKPSVARWKKWRRDLEGFVDTIGMSWKGTSGFLRQLRYRKQPFEGSELHEAIADERSAGRKPSTALTRRLTSSTV